jgi:hypothetical protein
MLLVYFLIVFFLILFAYKLFLYIFKDPLIEGLETQDTTKTEEIKEYQPYNVSDPNNSLILAQQNAGNIEVLKGRIDKLDGIKERVDTMQQNMDTMQVQIDGLVQQQADYAQELAGDSPVEVTGTGELTAEDVEEEQENA